MNLDVTSELTCSVCRFRGRFSPVSPRLLVTDVWHWLVERNLARRSLRCPECGTTVTSATRRWVPYAILLLIVAAGVIGAFVLSTTVN